MDARPVLLIDFSALFRRAWHVQTDVSIAYESTIGGVNRASAMLPEALVAICCDGKGNWRKKLAPDYKANRETQPAALYGEMDRTLDRLRKDGRLIWKFDGFEADDVIATAVTMATTRGHSCRIVSHDKDLLQLLGTWCDYVAIHKTPWEVVGPNVVLEKYGVEPSQFGDWLALVGDTSDNVKGCPGVGAKTATALLQKYHSLQGIYHAMDEPCDVCPGQDSNCLTCRGNGKKFDPVSTPANVKALETHRDSVMASRVLVSLSREVPIRFDEIYETREIAPIDERDTMGDAEQEAAKYFGQENDATKTAATPVKPDVVAEQREPERNGSGQSEQESDSLKQPQYSPVPAALEKQRDVAIAVRQETEVINVVEYARQLEPRSFKDAVIAADILFSSRVYSRYPTKQSMVAAIVRGREMGYGLGASLDMFHVADFNQDGNLRLMMHAHLIIEQATRHPDVEYFMLINSTDVECTYEAKRRSHPHPTPLTYTIEQARLANLIKPRSNWEKRPAEQLRKTCGAQLSRIIAPGAALGLYCAAEMGIDNE